LIQRETTEDKDRSDLMKLIASDRVGEDGDWLDEKDEYLSSLVDDQKYFMPATKKNINQIIHSFFTSSGQGRFFHSISTGDPHTIFESDYCLPEGRDIHSAISLAMDSHWTESTREKAKKLVEHQLEGINFSDDKLTKDEALALLYYTMDGPYNLGVKPSVYNCLTLTLVSRGLEKEQTDSWKHYLYLLLHGASKLPVFKGTVYRGVSVALSKIYSVNNKVTLITVTSTSEDSNTVKKWTGTSGTNMTLCVERGRQIAKYSFFPNEKEVLLLPNSEFLVTRRTEKDVDLVQNSNNTTPNLEMMSK